MTYASASTPLSCQNVVRLELLAITSTQTLPGHLELSFLLSLILVESCDTEGLFGQTVPEGRIVP